MKNPLSIRGPGRNLFHSIPRTHRGYWEVVLPIHEVVAVASAGLLCAGFVAQIFYEDMVFLLIFAPVGLFAIPSWRKVRANRRRERFLLQYQDMLYYLSVALSAGKSTEAAFSDAAKYLTAQYGGKQSDLLRELHGMSGRIALREPVEHVLKDLAVRTELADVRSLADVIAISRKSGGNLVEVIQQSVRVLREKIGIRREMETAWAAKKLEQRILCVSPVFLVLLLRGSGPDFMAPMYGTVTGRVIMTVALLLILAGYAIGAFMMRDRI